MANAALSAAAKVLGGQGGLRVRMRRPPGRRGPLSALEQCQHGEPRELRQAPGGREALVELVAHEPRNEKTARNLWKKS